MKLWKFIKEKTKKGNGLSMLFPDLKRLTHQLWEEGGPFFPWCVDENLAAIKQPHSFVQSHQSRTFWRCSCAHLQSTYESLPTLKMGTDLCPYDQKQWAKQYACSYSYKNQNPEGNAFYFCTHSRTNWPSWDERSLPNEFPWRNVSSIHHKSRPVCCQVQHYPCRGVNLYLLHLQSLRKDYITIMSAALCAG